MFREILNLLTREGRKDLFLASLFFTFYGLCSIGMVVAVFALLFKIMNGAGIRELYPFFFAIGFLVLCKGCFNMAADLKKHCAGFDIVQQIRARMIVKLKKFSLGFYTNERLGEVNTILHKDVDNMSLVVGHMWSRMFGDFFIGAISFAVLACLNLKQAAIMAAPVPVALVFLYASIQQSKAAENENNAALLDMVSLFVEYVRGIQVLKSFSNNKSLENDLACKTKRFGETSKKASRTKARQLAVFCFLLDMAYLLLIASGALFVLRGEMSAVDFIIFAVVSREFYKPFSSMEGYYMYYISAADSYQRLGKFLCAGVIPDRADGPIPKRNDIVFNNIEFSYGQEEFKIQNLSFTIPEKSMTALVGESGSGKTTVTNLLLRFYDVTKGSIALGGIDIREIPYDELLDRMSIVMQNVQLFDGTIEENIRIGKKNAPLEGIVEACKKARIHDFIMQLPQGYQTPIGENGGLLSGGQRQRLSIARAFLKDAPILILDEMTSNVDPINESMIQDAIARLAENRTVLVIAHHLKTIRHADQIMVFKKGELLEQGVHENLLKNSSYYAKLWSAQFDA